jgi:hypothetical protein
MILKTREYPDKQPMVQQRFRWIFDVEIAPA